MANRQCVEIRDNETRTIVIYICLNAIEEISKKIFTTNREQRFKHIIECIFRNQTNRQQYEMYKEYKGTSVMKLSKGGENLRIYCKVEERNNINYITLAKLHLKKNQNLTSKEINILTSIQNDSYEYKKWGK